MEIVHQHEDGDIVLVLEVTFRGDVRKLFPEAEEVSKQDAELAVATNIFKVVQLATTGPSDEASNGTTETED
jgi:hypothetical protein